MLGPANDAILPSANVNQPGTVTPHWLIALPPVAIFPFDHPLTLTPVTLPGMDDKPAIDFHPFGTITLNFDDRTIKLRRCRLGDLQFAKDHLEELRSERAEERQAWVDEVTGLRDYLTAPREGPLTDEEQDNLRAGIIRTNELAGKLDQDRIDLIYGFVSKVAERMGDGPIPPKEDWPLDLFTASVPNDILAHWQSRPLASGRISPNGTMREAATLPQSPPDPSYPPAPLPQ